MEIETIEFSDTSTFNFNGLTAMTSYGGDEADYIYGVQFSSHLNDTIYGFGGDDHLSGQDGDDTLNGGDGNDLLSGAADDDTYIMSAGYDRIDWDTSGSDVLWVPDGYDAGDLTLIRAGSNDLVVMIDGLGQIKIEGQLYYSGAYAVETLSFNGGSTINLATVQVESIGTTGNDTISGITAGASINDTIDGREGDDVLSGDLGDDVYFLSAGSDTINEQGGNDTIKLREGLTTGNVTVFREANGSSATSLVVQDQNGNRITAGPHFTVEGGGDNSDYRIEQIIFHDTTTWTLASMEIATKGSASADYIDGTTAGDASTADTIYGLGGGDSIYAASGNDWADGGDGNDTVSGGAGNDQLYGGAGDDYIKGDGDDDAIFAGIGLDLAEDDGGTNILHVVGGVTINDITLSTYSVYHTNIVINSGVDEIQVRYQESSPGNYAIESIRFDDGFITSLPDYASWIGGTSGNDSVSGNSSDNTLIGYAGNDTINSGSGNDDAHGGAGNDTLYGDGGTDLLHGGVGNDVLYGGDGLDTIYGGAGADTFKFQTASAFNNVDVVKDFSTAQADIIDLTDILGAAYNPLSDAIADFVSFSESSGSTFVSVDRDGTGGTYSMAQIIKLENVTGLASAETLETNGNLIAA